MNCILGKKYEIDKLKKNIGRQRVHKDMAIPPRPKKTIKFRRNFPGADYIEISPDDYITLHTHRIRTGITYKDLVENDPNSPQGLRVLTVASWFNGATRMAEKHYLHYVLERYCSTPDKVDPLKQTIIDYSYHCVITIED